jgi:hypothetical protein
MRSEINQNSILFLTASEDTSYGYLDGNKYIWTMGTLYPTNSYDEIIKDNEEVIATSITTMANTLGLNSSLNVEWSEESGLTEDTIKAAIEDIAKNKQDVLITGQNISIDASNNISAEGYVFNIINGAFAEKYKQLPNEGGQIVSNIISQSGSHAEGYNTESLNYGSHSEGYKTKALGVGSHAEGQSTEATGNYTHAEGSLNVASALAAHAEG